MESEKQSRKTFISLTRLICTLCLGVAPLLVYSCDKTIPKDPSTRPVAPIEQPTIPTSLRGTSWENVQKMDNILRYQTYSFEDATTVRYIIRDTERGKDEEIVADETCYYNYKAEKSTVYIEHKAPGETIIYEGKVDWKNSVLYVIDSQGSIPFYLKR